MAGAGVQGQGGPPAASITRRPVQNTTIDTTPMPARDERPPGGLLGCSAETTGHHHAEHDRRPDDGEADQHRHS